MTSGYAQAGHPVPDGNPRPAQDVMTELPAHPLPHSPTPDRPSTRLHI